MPAPLLWRPQAYADLLDIHDTIARDNPAAAERLYDAIEIRSRVLASHPYLGVRMQRLFGTA